MSNLRNGLNWPSFEADELELVEREVPAPKKKAKLMGLPGD